MRQLITQAFYYAIDGNIKLMSWNRKSLCESERERERVERERERERDRMYYSLYINRHDGFARKCQSILVLK